LVVLPEVEQVADSVFAEHGIDSLLPPHSAEELRRAQKILVAGRPPIGFAWINELGGLAHLEQLSVRPEAARQGVGTRLLAAACQWARLQGYPAMTLTTFRDIPWNEPFYARHGFQEIPDPSEAVRGLLEHEKALGIDKLGKRVAMIKDLSAEAS
jgi:GNAT superfamily N-acetyltransferase